MSTKPARVRPTRDDPGSRLVANVEPLIVGAPAPEQPPTVETLPALAAEVPVTVPTETPEPAIASTPPAPAPAIEPAGASTEEDEEIEAATAPKRKVAKKAAAQPRETPPAEEPTNKRARQEQFSVRVDMDLMAQARAVVLFTGPYGGPMSLIDFVESAMTREIKRLVDEFNDGEPYPALPGKFRTGRPLGR